MNEMIKRLSDSYDALQRLNIGAARGNLEILLSTMNTLRDAFNYLNELKQKDGGANGND